MLTTAVMILGFALAAALLCIAEVYIKLKDREDTIKKLDCIIRMMIEDKAIEDSELSCEYQGSMMRSESIKGK